jgi:outer membrane protein assembly factor BamB
MKFGDKTWRQGWRLMVIGLLFGVGGVVRAQDALPVATNLWSVKLAKLENTGSAPALAPDGTLYAGTFDGTLSAIGSNGKLKWRFKAGREIQSSPAIGDDGTIYFGSRDRHFYALTPAGKFKWQFTTGGWVDASPAIAADGTVYFGSWDKTFYALNPNGSVKWRFKTGAIVDSSPAIAADGTVYFGSHDQNFYALKPDGALRWKFATGGEIVSSPAIGKEGVIYFSSLDGNLYALNPDGTQRWRLHTDNWTRTSPVLDAQGDLVIGITNGIDTISADGKKICRRGADFMVGGAAAVVPGRIYVALSWFSLFAIAPDGHALWRANLDGHNVTASPTIGPDGIVYVCAGNRLYAIRPPGDLLPPTNSPWPMFRGNARHTGRVAVER